MVKARFPGKPSRHFNRRKVHGVNSDDNDANTIAEDVYRRLEVFYSLFHTEDVDNNFHGFSPHEVDKSHPEEIKPCSSNLVVKRPKKVHFSLKKHRRIRSFLSSSTSKECSDSNQGSFSEIPAATVKPVDVLLTDPATQESPSTLLPKQEFKDASSNPTLSGKFVLPSRSAHSSRVIKPNKRFLQGDDSNVPYKRSKLNTSESTDSSTSTFESNYSPHCKKPSTVGCSLSPVKFVLRKPRLKIKSQPLSTVGGPFTSPGGSGLNTQGLNHSSPSVKKVFCGVCGSLKTYKLFRQARKFGIFSCDPCRKFILKMIRSERQKLMQPLICSSGNGNCPIRNNSLVTQCFSTDTTDHKPVSEQDRCEACWLNLCLSSFHMPQKLAKRLSFFLPSQFSQKPIASFNNYLGTDWRGVASNDSLETPCNHPELRGSNSVNNESRIIRRNRGLRENINVRRGSAASHRLSSHRGRGHRDRELEESKRGRGRQKLPVAGPRVKHVCRSASLVLGQPVATFDSSTAAEKEECVPSSVAGAEVTDSKKTIEADESEHPEITNAKDQKSKDLVSDLGSPVLTEHKNIDYPPVARMLQDLGRANCELLDGMENHELERLNAKVSIDFWESYDPEEVSQMGFPLIGFSPLRLKALCFLCGSAGLEKMLHCASCCEPYHTFCVPNLSHNPSGDWWRLDWLCPKCTQCQACFKTGGSQLSCAKCQKSYHSGCISAARLNVSDNSWVCPSCLFCKSCNDSSVHVFVGNMPLCKTCFKLRKKGNFCPLCQCCYDDNDFNTKMMECAECKCWIHAQCEGISNEKYQVLSYLPSSIEFVCRICCKNPPAPWSIAVNTELRAGYLNVIKILSKNKYACAMFKASPKKQRVCVCSDKRRNPIHLPNLLNHSENESPGIDSDTSPDRDYKSSDLGLLTPKLTKDDEESLITVKSDFFNLVSSKDNPKDFIEKALSKNPELMPCPKETRLLSIVCDKLTCNPNNVIRDENQILNNIAVNEKQNIDSIDNICSCQCSADQDPSQTLSLLSVKHKAAGDEYNSVCEFHKDMECVMKEINNKELTDTYNRCLTQIFPWFDPNESRVSGSFLTGRESIDKNAILESPRKAENQDTMKKEYNSLKGILNLDQDCYYIGMNFQETRMCLFCKLVGEGFPTREGRLLYCGQNEWVHANCALWSSEVFEEIDGSLQNVHSAISRARLIRCLHCNKKGASLGCCAKTCPAAYHFACAKIADCVFLENKEVYCKAHSSMRGDRELQKEGDFHVKRSIYVELDHKKKKDIFKNYVKIYIGSLEVNQIGEILPDLSDFSDIIIPCDFQCSRLYWSSKEPWKIVRYSIRTKVTNICNDYTYENDTNYTIDHSLEITPPPSPIESLSTNDVINRELCITEVRQLLSQLVDTVCSREEEGNLSDQQTTDLLPPDLKDAIFNELPQDFLDRISVHDIFTKMSYDDLISSESKVEKSELIGSISHSDPLYKFKENSNSKSNQTQPKNIYKVVSMVKPKNIHQVKNCDMLQTEKVNKWNTQSIIQVDGAMDDLSESDHSNDSCDVNLQSNTVPNSENNEDEPVKCPRCHRTYRTKISYERHLPTCNADFSSCSDSDLSEEEKTQGLPDESSNIQHEIPITNVSNADSQMIVANSETQMFSIPVQMNTLSNGEHKLQTLVNENSVVCVNNSNISSLNENAGAVVNIEFSAISNGQMQNSTFPPEQSLVTSVDTVVSDSVMGLQQPTYILQQVSNENVIPSTFMTSSYQDPQQPNIQYVTAINTQEKTQFLSANSLGSNSFHIQPQQPMIQNVPTVVGTIIQSNGVEQLVLNNQAPQSIDVFGHQQNNMYIANSPMLVGMETVVSNTVMASSRFLSGATPSMLASSYSATTTQVFQAAKPVLDIPQGYVVLNTNHQIFDNNGACLQNVISNENMASWSGYKVAYQDGMKFNKNIEYQTSQQVVAHKQDVNGIQIINPNDQTIMLAAVPPVKLQNTPQRRKSPEKPNLFQRYSSNNKFHTLPSNPKSSNVKTVELPSSSAIHKEKPQQAVAPVVIKKVPETPKNIEGNPHPKPNHINSDTNNKTDGSRPVQPVNNIDDNPIPSDQETVPLKTSNPAFEEKSCNKDVKKYVPKIQKKEQLPNKRVVNSDIKTKKDFKNSDNKTTNSCGNNKKRKIVHEEPKVTFEITSEDGFCHSTPSLDEAWNTVFETVQNSRKCRGLPPLSQNPFSSPDSMLKKLMGLGNNSMKYIIEQLPGISSCSKYKPVYHKKAPSALEKELFKGKSINPTGCARTEKFKYTRKTYDMFSWLASRHRRPPKLLISDNDGLNGNSRRATSMSLPMAMRFRHLKETSKRSVGVFRSDIHGRGLFCLRDIDSGEMVIEYAGEVIRSALTDKRERYYTEKGIGCYMFRIDDKWVVDATMNGNAARFINHSCEPNCYSRVIDILGKKHILIFALRKILQGEELTYDYKFPLEEDKINCHCLSRKCRKYLN